MAAPTVLVVDDDAGFRAFVRAVLSDANVRILEASDGAAAVELAVLERPDLVLLDWRMPGQSGITACRQLREQEGLEGLRVAMVTGLDDERDRTLARHAGADAFLIKDGNPDTLVASIRRLLPGTPAEPLQG